MAAPAAKAPTKLAERLIEARLASGYEVPKQAADAAGITPSALYQLEDGKTKSLRGDTAAKLASIYPRYTITWLISGEGPKYTGQFRVADEAVPYWSQPVRTDAPTLAASITLVKLACENLEEDFDPEDQADAQLVLLACQYLQARNERSVNVENVVDFTKVLRQHRNGAADDGGKQ